jgi:hypothetical protein
MNVEEGVVGLVLGEVFHVQELAALDLLQQRLVRLQVDLQFLGDLALGGRAPEPVAQRVNGLLDAARLTGAGRASPSRWRAARRAWRRGCAG